jgi:hypothetical protein
LCSGIQIFPKINPTNICWCFSPKNIQFMEIVQGEEIQALSSKPTSAID